jgi:chemotaxis protein MotB
MKTKNIFLQGLLIAVLFTGCVSKKRYNGEMQTARSKQEKLEKELADAKANQSSTSSELEQKQKELAAKEAMLKERETKLDQLRSAFSAEKDAVANLKQQVCSALKCFSPDELTVKMKDGKLYVSMSENLLFPSGSDAVNKRGNEAIEMLSAVLKSSDLEVMVEGHTDNVPISTTRYKDNWDLSVCRATSVSRLMIQNGIKPERVISCGRGQFYPLADNSSETGRQQNRRTEIVLAPKLDKLWKLTEESDNPSATSAK